MVTRVGWAVLAAVLLVTARAFASDLNTTAAVVGLLRDFSPCNVAYEPLLPIEAFRSAFRGKIPVVYSRLPSETENFRALASRRVLLERFGQIQVTLATSNSYSAGKQDATLQTYIKEHMPAVRQLSDLANESWYLFGDTRGAAWQSLEHQYTPPLDASTSDPAVAFGLGGAGSGVSFHTHGPAHAESVLGSKLWLLAPPGRKPRFHADQTSLRWVYDALSGEIPQPCGEDACLAAISAALQRAGVMACRVDEGSAVYIPAHWWHATLNLHEWTAFVSTFTQEAH